MDKLRAAAQAALDALELSYMNGSAGLHKFELNEIGGAIEQLRTALTEQRVEPVDDVWFEDRNGASRKSPKDCQRFGANGVPEAVWVNGNRYTRREWQSLTEEERCNIWNQPDIYESPMRFALAIEAALKGKNCE